MGKITPIMFKATYASLVDRGTFYNIIHYHPYRDILQIWIISSAIVSIV